MSASKNGRWRAMRRRTAGLVVVGLVLSCTVTVATTAPAPAAPAEATPRNYGIIGDPTPSFDSGSTDLGIDCDDCTKEIALPFAVNVYGGNFTKAVVSSNGNVQFSTNNSTYANTCLPNASMGLMVAPYWDDLTTAGAPEYGVFSAVQGSSPNRRFTIHWWGRLLSEDTSVEFSVTFFEAPGGTNVDRPHISFNYCCLGTFPTAASGATIGVQRPGRGLYRQLSCNTALRLESRYSVLLASPVADFDGNGSTDIGVFRPANGAWYVRNGQTVLWGTNGDKPAPADYDKDGDTDIAVFRPSTGTWFLKDLGSVQFGTNGDIPVPGPYDINLVSSIVLYRPSTGTWFSLNGAPQQWGTSGDIPVPADYNGDGLLELAVFRPSSGYWFVRNGPTVHFGANGDIPVPGDYTGDGIADLAVFRPSNGYWFVRNGATVQFGINGDIPVPGHYNGDPLKAAVFRPSNGYWFVRDVVTAPFGLNGDIPLSKPLGSA